MQNKKLTTCLVLLPDSMNNRKEEFGNDRQISIADYLGNASKETKSRNKCTGNAK